MKYYAGEQWTKELIEFFWTHGNTLWKDRCAVAHTPGEDSPDNSSARSRQGAQQQAETVYAHAPLMLAHDRRVLDVPLEERLQSRTSELLAWAMTMLPVINRSVRHARVELQTGHQDLRSYFSHATVATTDHTAATPTVTSPSRHEAPLLGIRQRFQSARTRMATLSSDIRQYFPGIADSTTKSHRTSTNNHVHELTNLRTGRRSGSSLSYIGTDATGLKNKITLSWY
jgi:hypothetical protein